MLGDVASAADAVAAAPPNIMLAANSTPAARIMVFSWVFSLMYRCTTTKAAFGTPESVLQPESRASPAEGNTTIGHFPACLRVQNITEKNATGTP